VRQLEIEVLNIIDARCNHDGVMFNYVFFKLLYNIDFNSYVLYN